jgi:hypothetical protein
MKISNAGLITIKHREFKCYLVLGYAADVRINLHLQFSGQQNKQQCNIIPAGKLNGSDADCLKN